MPNSEQASHDVCRSFPGSFQADVGRLRWLTVTLNTSVEPGVEGQSEMSDLE